jgi:hypothetical protein
LLLVEVGVDSPMAVVAVPEDTEQPLVSLFLRVLHML